MSDVNVGGKHFSDGVKQNQLERVKVKIAIDGCNIQRKSFCNTQTYTTLLILHQHFSCCREGSSCFEQSLEVCIAWRLGHYYMSCVYSGNYLLSFHITNKLLNFFSPAGHSISVCKLAPCRGANEPLEKHQIYSIILSAYR